MRKRGWIHWAGLALAGVSPLAGQSVAAPTPAGRIFNIVAYGAVGDRKTFNTEAFQRAIAACHRAGGGIVEVPAGRFLTGPIDLVDNLTLQIDSGALVLFAEDKALYPPIRSRWEGTMEVGPHPLLFADGLHHIVITGGGTVDGQGAAWWATMDPGERGDSRPNRPIRRRPPLVQIRNCDDVRIEGVTFQNSPFWNLHLLLSDHIEVGHCRFLNPPDAPNADGVDLDSCREVLVHDCELSVGDDGICIKSGRDEEGRALARPSEDITLLRDVVVHGHGVMVIGSEMSGGVRHIRVQDCEGIGTQRGIRIKSLRGRGGLVEDIVVSHLRLQNVGTAIELSLRYADTRAEPFSERTPVFRDFHFDHVVGTGLDRGVTIEGLPESLIRDVTFTAMDLAGRTGVDCSYAGDVTFTDVKIAAPLGKFSVDHSVNVRRVEAP